MAFSIYVKFFNDFCLRSDRGGDTGKATGPCRWCTESLFNLCRCRAIYSRKSHARILDGTFAQVWRRIWCCHRTPRRVGPFDAVASRYGLKCQNADKIALTKLDVLSMMKEIPVIVGYKKGNQEVTDFDPIEDLEEYVPIVRMLPGWQTDISGCVTYDELPDAAKTYVETLEDLLQHEIQFISVGAERSQYLTKGEWL